MARTRKSAGVSRVLLRAMKGDGWQNAYTGYGTSRDKLTYGRHATSARLDDQELSDLFYTEDIAAKLVEKRPEEAFRRGYKLRGDDETEAADLAEKGRALDVDAKLQEAWTWARLFGGSLLIIGADDGNKPDQPLDEAKVREIKFLNVVDRRFATVVDYYSDPFLPNYGTPKIYEIASTLESPTAVTSRSLTRVHESRVIRFDGLAVDAWKRRDLAGWSFSVLQRPYDVMRAFATAFQAAGVLTADASQAVFKMKGLFEMIASGQKAALQTRMQLVDMSRSAARAVLLDADGEEFTRIATQFQGLPDMLDRFMMRLASSVDMPVTILMGRSPAGQNATGDSDFQHWYDSIVSQQAKVLTPKLLRFYTLLSGGKAKGLRVEWLPLSEPTEKEKADIAYTKAQAYNLYINNGTLFAEEVALAEFGKDGNGTIEIDEEARKESLEASIELALNPPPPVVAPPPADPNGVGTPNAPKGGTPPTSPSAGVVPNAPAR